MQVQFGKDVTDMGLNGGFTDKQLPGDLFIGIALAQQLHDFLFPPADALITHFDGKRFVLLLHRIFLRNGTVHVQQPEHAFQQHQDIPSSFFAVAGNMETLLQIFGNGTVFIRKASDTGKSGQPVIKINRDIQTGNPERTYMDEGFPFLHGLPVHLEILLAAHSMILIRLRAAFMLNLLVRKTTKQKTAQSKAPHISTDVCSCICAVIIISVL